MENRERDRMSQRSSPTEAGEINRRTEERKGREDGSSVEFGKNVGRGENLDANTTGGSMNNNRNRQQGSMENESSRRSGGESGYGSSPGRSGSSDSSSSKLNRDRQEGESDVSSSRSGSSDRSEGRH